MDNALIVHNRLTTLTWGAPRPVGRRRALWHRAAMSLLGALVLMLGVGAEMAVAGAAETPHALVRQTTEAMLTALRNDAEHTKTHPAHVYQLAQEIILPHFDLQKMSSWVLGKHWKRASADQRERFPQEFRRLLLRTYATALSEYSDQEVVYLPGGQDKNAERATVRTEIHPATGPAIPVSYRLYNDGSAWKVYDISIDGISLIATYRTTFSSEIRRGGLDGLIERLSARNEQVAAAN